MQATLRTASFADEAAALDLIEELRSGMSGTDAHRFYRREGLTQGFTFQRGTE